MAYIGNQPVLQSTEFREEFFPSSNQSAFTTGGFHPSAVSVTRNGVLLSESDYTKGSDNVTITLNSAAVSGDVVVIRGNRSLAQGVSVSESRVEYTWQSGNTVVQLNADVIPLYTDVYLNGVKLAAADYSINASTKQVSFTSAPAVGDVIAVVHKNETSALVGLPLKDSSGAAILSESGSTVTLANVDTATIGSNALVVNSSGKVGIGTNTGGGNLNMQTGSGVDCYTSYRGNNNTEAGELYVGQAANNYGYVFNRANAALELGTNNTAQMRIDPSGLFSFFTDTTSGFTTSLKFKTESLNGTSKTFSVLGTVGGLFIANFFNATNGAQGVRAWFYRNGSSNSIVNDDATGSGVSWTLSGMTWSYSSSSAIKGAITHFAI